ncbi:MAG: hypothetical protein AAGI66_08065, partial [Cyanobacteria bacterium P01_H01_bin.74]
QLYQCSLAKAVSEGSGSRHFTPQNQQLLLFFQTCYGALHWRKNLLFEVGKLKLTHSRSLGGCATLKIV